MTKEEIAAKRKESQRKYSASEKGRARTKRHNEKRKEYLKEYYRRYYQEHKDELNAKGRVYYEEHKEKWRNQYKKKGEKANGEDIKTGDASKN